MRPFGALLSFEEAVKIVDTNIKAVDRVETVDVDEAVGRVLANDFVAKLDTPPFNRGAMDGYAVIAENTFGSSELKPKVLDLIGTVHAGDNPTEKVGAGQCVQIATGAVMPEGATAVVMVEDTEVEESKIKIFKASLPGQHVGKRGEDIKAGESVLKKGAVLDAAKIGVLTSQGLTSVKVYAKPRVGILPSGEEVAEIGSELGPGQIYDINSHTIASLVKDNGGLPVRMGIVGDTVEDIKTKISAALKDNDLVIISGGSSVGDRDLIVGVLEDWGEVLFHGIQIKPGKPTLFAIVEDKPLFGMPGYPTSCLVNAYLFLMPVIRKMAHLGLRPGKTVEAKLGRRVQGSVGRKQFLTVKVEDGEVFSVFKESGAITSIAAADGYIEIEQNVDVLEKGTPVTVTLF